MFHLVQYFERAGRLEVKFEAWSIGLPAFARNVYKIAHAKIRRAAFLIGLSLLFGLDRQ